MPVRGRVILNGPRCGTWNMALDEGLLLSAREDLVTLRLYGWSPPTLSLGYFQRRREVAGEMALRYPLVRRPTGGGAMIHQLGEITISLTGRSKRPPRTEEAAGWVLEGVRRALIPWSIQPRFAGGEPETVRHDLPFFCAAIKRPLDVLVDLPEGPRKLMGTGQRRKGQAWLIHGGLLISPPPETTQNSRESWETTLLEVLSKNPDWTGPIPREEELRNQLLETLVEAFGAVFHRQFLPEPLSSDESRLTFQLLAERYATPGWLERR